MSFRNSTIMNRINHLAMQGIRSDAAGMGKPAKGVEREAITAEDEKLIKHWKGGSGRAAEIALSVSRQGWITSKQRAVMKNAMTPRKPRGWGRGGNRQQADYDYDAGGDFDIGAYELCVGEWGE